MAGVKGKSGLKKGQGGRIPGAMNKVHYNVKKKLEDCVDELFIQKIFSEIEAIESVSERVKARMKVIEFLVPKPKAPEEVEQDNEFRKVFLERMFPKRKIE